MYDIQTATMTKRISALLLDIIAFMIVAAFLAYTISLVVKMDEAFTELETAEAEFTRQFDIDFEITEEEYNQLTETEKQHYNEVSKQADELFRSDSGVQNALRKTIWLSVFILSFSFLLSFIVLEIIVPRILGHGRSIGKKVFGLAVMHDNGLRISGTALFARSILGKCVLESLIPAFIVMMIAFGFIGLVGTVVLLLILVLQLILCFTDRNRRILHDRLASTVVVDFNSQMIFDTPKARDAYIAAHSRS